jgi:hypothetical protein
MYVYFGLYKRGHGQAAKACPTFRKGLVTNHQKDAFFKFIFITFLGEFAVSASPFHVCSVQYSCTGVPEEREENNIIAIRRTEPGKDDTRSAESIRGCATALT